MMTIDIKSILKHYESNPNLHFHGSENGPYTTIDSISRIKARIVDSADNISVLPIAQALHEVVMKPSHRVSIGTAAIHHMYCGTRALSNDTAFVFEPPQIGMVLYRENDGVYGETINGFHALHMNVYKTESSFFKRMFKNVKNIRECAYKMLYHHRLTFTIPLLSDYKQEEVISSVKRLFPDNDYQIHNIYFKFQGNVVTAVVETFDRIDVPCRPMKYDVGRLKLVLNATDVQREFVYVNWSGSIAQTLNESYSKNHDIKYDHEAMIYDTLTYIDRNVGNCIKPRFKD